MKVHFSGKGDMSVGIYPVEGELEINCEIDDRKERDQFRKDFSQFIFDWFDDWVDIWFDDECPNCKENLINGKCKNPKCISVIGRKLAKKQKESIKQEG